MMKISSLLSATIASVGIVAASSAFSVAEAFYFSGTGVSAGSPSGEIQQVFELKQGDTFPVSWDYVIDNDLTLSAKALVSIAELTESTLKVKITNLTNNSIANPSIYDRVDITAFGFGTPDFNATVASSTGGSTLDEASSSSIPGFGNNVGFFRVDACAFGGSNCQGGSNVGIGIGESDSFTVTLTNPNTPFDVTNGVTLSTFALKWQTTIDSYETVATEVPTPALLPGLLGMGVAALRKRKEEEEAVETKKVKQAV